MRQFFYYKLRQFCYKIRQLLQNAMVLLQNAAVITKCNVYYKMRQQIHPPNKTQAVTRNQFFLKFGLSTFNTILFLLSGCARFLNFNPFHPSTAILIESSHLISNANQMTRFYKECNTGLKWVDIWFVASVTCSEVYSRPSQTFNIELFAKKVNGLNPLTIFS